ncbi:T9SS type A sorting domain-containing protein [Flavobacterium okayamense]|uniref:T9SS C-terminal target domain-containing protein n=1 Tax=Flavobacterium okayamense TaxID=2830782 RepID=A0ABM7SB58_9FLAO|nr:T9SS type A sorting domain-containing protein [Flavobacterium okayamense]BCY28052.1 T9SS C-terminal target domain-containing protein [Flavobacterium okayamense]
MPMVKKYFYIFLLMVSFNSLSIVAQESGSIKKQDPPTIEGLTIYPNPSGIGKVYISSKSTSEKKIEIFDVLGKKVLETVTSGKEVNISSLSPGVYIIKVKENEASATRKLIIN